VPKKSVGAEHDSGKDLTSLRSYKGRLKDTNDLQHLRLPTEVATVYGEVKGIGMSPRETGAYTFLKRHMDDVTSVYVG
jgi:hypothetical protein